jgi:tryptophan synthase alpha chain
VREVLQALAKSGVDAIEIGFPYSDPVMDRVQVIQQAADISLKSGTNAADVFETLKFASATGSSGCCDDILESR